MTLVVSQMNWFNTETVNDLADKVLTFLSRNHSTSVNMNLMSGTMRQTYQLQRHADLINEHSVLKQ